MDKKVGSKRNGFYRFNWRFIKDKLMERMMEVSDKFWN